MASVAAACAARVIACIVWLPAETQVHGRCFARVAEHDVALLPGHVEHLGRRPVDVEQRVRAEIANARLERDAAVRLDDEEPVEADRAAAYGLTATPMPRAFVPFLCVVASAALRFSQSNMSRPLSSASFTKALVTYAWRPVGSGGPNGAWPTGRIDLPNARPGRGRAASRPSR